MQCEFEGCDKSILAKGLCGGHYAQQRQEKPLKPLRVTISTLGECLFEGCKQPREAKGYCHGHYRQFRLGKSLESLQARIPKGTWTNVTTCTHSGCDRAFYAGGLCSGHYCRQWKNQNLDPPLRKPRRPIGKPFTNCNGYVLIHKPKSPMAHKNGHVLLHRLIMSEYLGRPLSSNETVHHKNGDKADNRIENLELWIGNHGKGSRLEDQIHMAIQLLQKYAPEMLIGRVDVWQLAKAK